MKTDRKAQPPLVDPNKWGKSMVNRLTEKLDRNDAISGQSATVKGSGKRGSTKSS